MQTTHLPAQQRPSLTHRLLAWSLGALMLVWVSFVLVGYHVGQHEADEVTDGHLATLAAVLLQAPAPTAVATATAPPALRLAHEYQQTPSVFQWNAQGQLLARVGDAPPPTFDTHQGFATVALPGGQWRSFALWDEARQRKVMVLLDIADRDALARDIAGQMIEPGLWLLPVVALALGFAVRRGLRPVYDLSHDVAALDGYGTQRLAPSHAWREFASVVASINTLLDKQAASLARERRFASEVAHELRTPLSSITLQASALATALGKVQADPGAQPQQMLARIQGDALRAGHVLGQLLALARTSSTALHEPAQDIDMAALARTVCAEYAQAAWQRGDTIVLEAPPTMPWRGHPVLLEVALRNLLENALKHPPPGTRIAVQMGMGQPLVGNASPTPSAPSLLPTIPTAAWLQVCDDGARPAAPAAPTVAANHPQPHRPTQNANTESLHLGHAIVSRVAQVHAATFGPAPAPAPYTTCYRLAFAAPPGNSPG